MVLTLLKLSDTFYVNPEFIAKVEVVSIAAQGRKNGIHFRESSTIDPSKQFMVSILLRAGSENADQFQVYFATLREAQTYVSNVFTNVVTSV